MNKQKIKIKIENLSPELLADAMQNNGYSQCRQMIIDKQISGRALLKMTEFQLKQYRHYLNQADITRLFSFLVRINDHPEDFVFPITINELSPPIKLTEVDSVESVKNEEPLEDPNEWDDPPPVEPVVDNTEFGRKYKPLKNIKELPPKPVMLPKPVKLPPHYENVGLKTSKHAPPPRPIKPAELINAPATKPVENEIKPSNFKNVKNLLESSLILQPAPVKPDVDTEEPVEIRKRPIPIPPKVPPSLIPGPPEENDYDEDDYEPSPILSIGDIPRNTIKSLTAPNNNVAQPFNRPLPAIPIYDEDKQGRFETPPTPIKIAKPLIGDLKPLPTPDIDDNEGYIKPISRPLPPVPMPKPIDHQQLLKSHPAFKTVDRIRGDQILAKKPVGSFLFRTSGNYYCTMMVKAPGRICNIPVLLENDMICLQSEASESMMFEDLNDLVEYYRDEDIPLNDTNLRLIL